MSDEPTRRGSTGGTSGKNAGKAPLTRHFADFPLAVGFGRCLSSGIVSALPYPGVSIVGGNGQVTKGMPAHGPV